MKMEQFLDRLSDCQMLNKVLCLLDGCEVQYYEGWNFNSGNYLFTTDTKYS